MGHILHEKINRWPRFKQVQNMMPSLYVVFEELKLDDRKQEIVFLGLKALDETDVRKVFKNKDTIRGKVEEILLVHSEQRKREEPGLWSALWQRWFG